MHGLLWDSENNVCLDVCAYGSDQHHTKVIGRKIHQFSLLMVEITQTTKK